jgi:hypothetical protein
MADEKENSQTTNEKNKLRDEIANKARKLLVLSQQYKQPRMDRVSFFEALYNNDVPPRLRQMFNVIPPVFSGMVDSLLSQFNDEVKIKFTSKNPAQHLVIPKLQAQWDAEKDSPAPTARWNYKARTDRFNAVLSGRGILQEYAYNDPEYTNVLRVINYSDFHCEPLGGGLLDNHSFKGVEGCFKTKYDLENSSKYDKEQVKKLAEFKPNDNYFTEVEKTYGTRFERWRALGFDPANNTFSADAKYNFCDFIVKHEGKEWNVVFEPVTGIWVYCEEWEGRCPFHSWATHEDDKNFWSKGFADDFYNVADAIIIMVNQELTNREKKNFHSRAFDKDMFTDIAKLDAAQYKADSLVPANTMGGTKQIANGIYEFQTPELKGTIDLVSWLSTYTADKIGTDEISPVPHAGGKANISVQLAQQAKQSKRIGLRADSFKECYSALGETYIEGLVEYMPAKLSVQVMGENGFVEDAELRRIEVKGLKGNNGKVNIGITVTSTSEQEQADQLKKDARVKAIQLVTGSKVPLTKYEKETIYRNVGQFSDDEITFLLDEQGLMSKKQIAHASRDIQDILQGKEPDIYYGADLSYFTYLNNYILDNKNHVLGKEEKFMALIQTMSPIVQQNEVRKAKNAPPKPQMGPDGKPIAPGSDQGGGAGGAPPMGKLSMAGSVNRMGAMAQ